MQVDDPPYLTVGTAVSAKYKGAFCEAKVRNVVRIVRCKIQYKMGLGTTVVNDDQIKGTLRVGHVVQVKHPERKELVEATIQKIQDCSQYTVVFDDGDITTLRRTALCLKSGRHFNESETLDQLPLTHPEHFGNPVVGGRRGRRNRQLKEDSSEGEAEEENEPDLEGYSNDIGRVVSIEITDKKRGKDNWFPGLVVIPSAQPTVRINVKDEYLVRSFKDGRYYTVPKKEVSEFNREVGDKVESLVLSEAVNKALKYLDHNELPVHWERSSLFNIQSMDSDSDDNMSDSSDDEPCEEKDHFVAQLYKFMDDAGTPLNKSPVIANKDVDLHRLFRVVQKLGGYNRVTNQNKWKSVSNRLKLPNNQNALNQVKQVYKKCLLSYEAFHRTLGVTMLNHTRPTKKNRGRSLIRDKDRFTPVNSPKPENKDEIEFIEKKDEEIKEDKNKKLKIEEKKKKDINENSDTNVETNDQLESIPSTSKEIGRPKRIDKKDIKKIKTLIEPQQTRSKVKNNINNNNNNNKEIQLSIDKKKEIKSKTNKNNDDGKKKGKKKTISDDNKNINNINGQFNIGDKLKVYYGPNHESKVTYEAKIIDIEKDQSEPAYLVHYTGWNTRYDEWITASRIAENLSASTKSKKLQKQPTTTQNQIQTSNKIKETQSINKNIICTKRGRGISTSSRNSDVTIPSQLPSLPPPPPPPRSTTPSSTTSTSSRTKSPATPATRSTSRLTRQDYNNRKTRRTSAQTDNSNHSDSESEIDSENDLINKNKNIGKIIIDNDNEKPSSSSSSSSNKRKIRNNKKKLKGKQKKSSEKSIEGGESYEEEGDEEEDEDEMEDEDNGDEIEEEQDDEVEEENNDICKNLPKGRDFDLNQIRSELKGFSKIKVVDSDDKEQLLSSSSLSSSSSDDLNKNYEIEIKDIKKEKTPLISNNEDIYEFKEPEPFEFESRHSTKLGDDKIKKRTPRLFDDLDKSPIKENKDNLLEIEKKHFVKTSIKEIERKKDDPFDKLVESPSFNIIKSIDNKEKINKNLIDNKSCGLFRELPETVDDLSRDMELFDSENQLPIFKQDELLFNNDIIKPSTEQKTNTLELPFNKDDIRKDSDEECDSLRESIQRAIANSSSDDDNDDVNDDNNDNNDDSNDTLLIVTPSASNYQIKRKETDLNNEKIKPNEIKKNLKEEIIKTPIIKTISPALQETDSSLMEAIKSQPLSTNIEQETKDITIKPIFTKIADSILEKFNSLKNEKENEIEKIDKEKTKELIKVEPEEKKNEILNEKKRRKILSKRFIEESDSNSSDSEQLVIARSDDDSQISNNQEKIDFKDNDRKVLKTDDDDNRNFKFSDLSKKDDIVTTTTTITPTTSSTLTIKPKELETFLVTSSSSIEKEKIEQDNKKNDETDSNLHSLLLCEETLPPRSPTSAPEPQNDITKSSKSLSNNKNLEMPFASAPSCSNNKNILLNNNDNKNGQQQQPIALVPIIENNRDVPNTTVIENTPPTTPESTISNLSPRNDHGDLMSPNNENESGKSNDGDFSTRKRRNSNNKVHPYSEEDTQMTSEPSSTKKLREEVVPASCKKRRKSNRGCDDLTPAKRGRKPLNRSRHNSDSDDTSEHSICGVNTNLSINPYENRTSRSPRPSKYNFYVEFDPSLNSGQRIAVLQQKLTELRKTYANVKAELAAVERRRKKIRRREREALKASKQEMACA